MGTYVIRGGNEGRERLRVLARVFWPTTGALLSEVGVGPTARCLDWGCGGGDVTTALARRLPGGFVIGADLDEVALGLARAEAAAAGVGNVEFVVGDVLRPPVEPAGNDLVYARFLLTHLADPELAVDNMVASLVPGGTLVVEDIDFSAHFCDPPSPAFSGFVELYTRLVRDRGGDAEIGPRLPRMLRAAGLEDVGMHVVQPASFEGEVKLVTPITLEAIAEGLVEAQLVSEEDLTRMVEDLHAFAATDGTVMSLPRIVQSWGRRPGQASGQR